MKISIISVFPDLYDQFLNTSLIKRAQEKKLIEFNLDSYFSFCEPKQRMDAPSFGHGTGVLIKPEIVEKAIEDKEKKFGKAYKIFFSPQGKKLDQKLIKTISKEITKKQHLLLLPARYEGMDSRVEDVYADEIISIGDYVLMDGDLPAMVFLEGLLRYVPGVVGKEESVEKESFSGPFLDYPEFTAPVIWKGLEVPEVIRSGNHAEIQKWRENSAAKKTILKNFEWLRSSVKSKKDIDLAKKYIPNHYAALMHTDVIVKGRGVGTTSVTSFDIHDIARSSKTYGLKQFYLVTPLKDQQKIVNTILDFWTEGPGAEYNESRYEAIKQVSIKDKFDEVISSIESIEGKKPIVIATSARDEDPEKIITYFDQGKVWEQDRPILIVFGTGGGLSNDFLRQCDYLLLPIKGFADFNHLSVRSAAAVIFDRWLGINLKE